MIIGYKLSNRMDKKIRKAQLEILKIFSLKAKSFALAGGTALELYYLRHRFSVDLDFFSPEYNLDEIEGLAGSFRKLSGYKFKLQSDFVAGGRARVRFYTASIPGSSRPLKIDFVEDVIFKNPAIRKFNGVPVYSVDNIYLQKITAVTGTSPIEDDIGRVVFRGRRQARDAFDIYVLSRKARPLHIFLKKLSVPLQRGMVHWYQTFSRQDLKLDLLDLDIYDAAFDAKEMIIYLENEIKKFISRELK